MIDPSKTNVLVSAIPLTLHDWSAWQYYVQLFILMYYQVSMHFKIFVVHFGSTNRLTTNCKNWF